MRFLNQRDLGSLPKIFISSLLTIFFFYSMPLMVNYSKNKSRSSRYLPENKIEQAYLFEAYKNKVLKPSKKELEINNRARSAKLRFAIRSNTDFQYPHELIDKFKNYLELESANV